MNRGEDGLKWPDGRWLIQWTRRVSKSQTEQRKKRGKFASLLIHHVSFCLTHSGLGSEYEADDDGGELQAATGLFSGWMGDGTGAGG